MVRKWSYLEINNQPQDLGILKRTPKTTLKKRHTFKVFRATTRFKKWTVGLTRVVRKKYIRRKHLTTLMNLNYITNSWVSTYLKQRNFVRFYQGLGLTATQLIAPISCVVVQKAGSPDFDKENGLLTLGVSSKLLNRLSTLRVNPKHNYRFINASKATSTGKALLFRPNSPVASTNELFSPLLEVGNLQTISNTPELETLQTGPNHDGYNSYESSLILSIYKVMILTTLVNTNQQPNE